MEDVVHSQSRFTLAAEKWSSRKPREKEQHRLATSSRRFFFFFFATVDRRRDPIAFDASKQLAVPSSRYDFLPRSRGGTQLQDEDGENFKPSRGSTKLVAQSVSQVDHQVAPPRRTVPADTASTPSFWILWGMQVFGFRGARTRQTHKSSIALHSCTLKTKTSPGSCRKKNSRVLPKPLSVTQDS